MATIKATKKTTKTPVAKTPVAKTPTTPTKTAKKKVTLVAETPAKTVKATPMKAVETRGRKIGTLAFTWVKTPKEVWPSALECNIMDACEAVEHGTSGDVTAYALKHGLLDLTKQIPNKVVTHVMVKLRKAGIIAGVYKDAKKAQAEKTPVSKSVKTAKKAKKSRVVLGPAVTAVDETSVPL